MQRSRKALLQKRAAVTEKGVMGRMYLYKVSIFAVLLIWGIIFLLSSLTSYGNGYRESEAYGTPISMGDDATPEEEVLAGEDINLTLSSSEKEHAAEETFDRVDGPSAVVGESSGHDIQPYSYEGSDSAGAVADAENKDTPDRDEQKMPTSMGEDAATDVEVIASKGIGVAEEISDNGMKGQKEIPVKSDRLSRVAPPGLDEFKSKLITAKENHVSSQTGTVIHRVEPGGKEYNYASAKNGAKVLAYNKEAKGASNILEKDKDKYLRNPCSAEGKYIVIELSEETLVDIIEIANFEHYSSNLKDFELLSSLSYPSDNWVKVGNFTAANVKHAQKFSLPEPKWARYLKVNLLSHYGSEFYCTLSVVEVYGVDAVERMLEDFISADNKRMESEEQNAVQILAEEPTEGDHPYQELPKEIDNESRHGSPKMKVEMPKNTVPDSSIDNRPPQVGRMPGDTVLKILMQKVHTLDVNFAVLEGYLEELNRRYGNIFKEFDDDLAAKDLLLEKLSSVIKDLQNSKEIFASDIGQLLSWKSSVSSQMEHLVEDNRNLRLEVNRIQDRQVEMENKGFAVIFMCFIFGCLAIIQLFVGVVSSICRIQSGDKFCRASAAWLVLLLSSSLIAFILVL